MLPKLPIAKQTEADVAAFVRRYESDPSLFAAEILGLIFDEAQNEMAKLCSSGTRVAIASAKGCGKSTVSAALAIWFAFTRSPALVVVTSNTAAQTTRTLWAYLARYLRESAISDWADVNSAGVKIVGGEVVILPQIWSDYKLESSSGVHCEHLLYIIDEASGVPDLMISNFWATCTQADNRLVLISNPTRISGFFHGCFRPESGWGTLSIDGRNSSLTNKKHLEALIDQYGLESDLVRVQVLGQFPRSSANRPISQAALNRWTANSPAVSSGSGVLGIDVGAGGDETVWAVRSGSRFEIARREKTENLERIVDETMAICNAWPIDAVCVDSTGVGAFVPAALRDALPGLRIFGIDFGDPSPEPDCYNTRAWMYRRLGDWLQRNTDASISGDYGDLPEQVEATESFVDERTGKTRLVKKSTIAAVVGHSPDVLDALALTCAAPGELSRVAFPKTDGPNSPDLSALLSRASKWSQK